MGAAAPSDPDRTIPVRARHEEIVPTGPPAEVTRSLIVVVGVIATLAVVVVLFSQDRKSVV